MAQYRNFYNTADNDYQKPSKTVERMNKDSLVDLYKRLDIELAQRAGYQSVALMAPELQSDAAT